MSNDMARRRGRLAREQGGMCPECTLPLPEDLAGTEVDHIIPRARGGPDMPWNRQLVHFSCNRTKRFTLTHAARALAAEYGITLREPPKPRLPYWLSRHRPGEPERPEPTEISRWEKHKDCHRYDQRAGGVIPSETACGECLGLWERRPHA